MMETVGSFEAKTHLAQLLERVVQGESFTITRHGIPVARLVPVEAKVKPDIKRAIEEILEFRQAHPLPEEDLKEWINEGRRL
jgi:prevent-host-death family protein